MAEAINLEALGRDVERDLRALQERLPGWATGAPYADPVCPPLLPARRERERLERLARAERRQRHERARERLARERTRPWLEQDRFELRKRVWRERGERECTLVDLRERAVLDRERELADWLVRHGDWLRELAALDPASRAWCAEQLHRSEQGEISAALLADIHRRWREAAASRARALLARDDVRDGLCPLLATTPRDPTTIARAITPFLAGLPSGGGVAAPVLPVVVASTALELARRGVAEYCAATRTATPLC